MIPHHHRTDAGHVVELLLASNHFLGNSFDATIANLVISNGLNCFDELLSYLNEYSKGH